MKKRLLSALLALALVFVLLPTTALAEVTTGDDYDISINGRGWKFEKDTTSGAYIPVYYYHTGVFDNANNKNRTNDNLELTKEGNTVTITIRRGTSHDYRVYPIEFTLEKISTTSGSPYDFTPCIEMGNGNSLVITGKGTLNITRDEKNGIGAALCSEVGDITITDGITVKANFLKQVSNSTVGNAISVKDHNLIISGKNTKVEARNSSCNFQDLYDVSATVCVENGEIKVSDGATLSAINNFTNSHTSQYSYYSRAISGSSSKPCALTVTGENSCVIAETDNSLGKAYGHVNFSIDGAKIEVGTSSPAQTITDINNIKNYKYAKISVPALQRTSDVFIAGEKAVVGQWTTITADSCSGSYFYDADKKELTLKDVNITHSDGAIVQFMAGAPYIIKLEGTNSIKDVSSFIRVPENENAYESLDGLSVTISGAGSLEVIARGNAITMLKGNLIFNNTGAIALETTTINGKAINVSGDISIGSDFNKNLRITADNGDMTFDPTNQYTDYNDLKNYKSITIASKPSETYYNDKAMKYGETRNAGSGTISCDENGAITLNGATEGTLEFRSSADSTLVLEGTNTLSSIVTTQKGLTISGSGSLTVGSIRVPNITRHTANLTINGGAHVTVNRPSSEDKPAVEVSGNLTVTGDGTQLSAECTAATNPAIEVGGNASFTGSTVTITNHSTALHKDAADKIKGDSVSSALYVKGNINTDNANVTAKVENGGGNAIGAVGNITVNGSTVTAVNKGQKFTTIIAENVYVSGDSKITANNLNKNPPYKDSYLAFPAIEGKIVNQNTDYSLKFEGQHSRTSVPKTTLAPGEQTTLYYYNVTITRGDEVTSTQSPVVIDGTTLLNDTYYTITNGTVAEGTESNYNAFYDSETKTLKLNNAKISHSFAYEDGGGQDGAIIFKEFENYFIELSGENTISSTNTYAINCHRPDRTLTIKNAAEAENAKLTLTSNWMVICSIGGLNIQSDVTMVNTKRADYLMYVNGTFSYTGYNAYASTEASGSPLEVYNPQNYSTYKYLRITKENLAPTTPTTYTVTITAGDNMKHESGALTQEVTKGAAITEVKFMAASGHYFPADYVSKMNLPAGLTAEIRENSWYLIISGTPTSDVTINLPAASVRPTITVSMPTPVAGNTPATASNITLTYSDINKSISKNLTISNVVWQSYVPNGDGSITPGEALSSGDKFEAGKTYFVRVTHEYVAGDYDIVPAAGITLDYTESDSTYMMLLFYTTGAPCNHEYTNDWLANGNTHWHECKLCRAHAGEVAHTFGDWITDTPATDTTDGSKHRTCSVCQYQENATIPKTGTGEIVPPTPDNPGTIVIIRPAEEEKPAQQPNPSTGANDLVGLAVAAAVAAALGSAALLRKHD